jgi:hypothetical protein
MASILGHFPSWTESLPAELVPSIPTPLPSAYAMECTGHPGRRGDGLSSDARGKTAARFHKSVANPLTVRRVKTELPMRELGGSRCPLCGLPMSFSAQIPSTGRQQRICCFIGAIRATA